MELSADKEGWTRLAQESTSCAGCRRAGWTTYASNGWTSRPSRHDKLDQLDPLSGSLRPSAGRRCLPFSAIALAPWDGLSRPAIRSGLIPTGPLEKPPISTAPRRGGQSVLQNSRERAGERGYTVRGSARKRVADASQMAFATPNMRSSRNLAATSWMPTGRPLSANPNGTEMAGCWVRLKGWQ